MVRGEESQDEWFFEVNGLSDSVVFGPVDGFGIEEIEADRIPFEFGFVEESGTKRHPFLLSNLTFEDRLLHADPVVRTGARDASKPAGSSVIRSSDVVGDKDKHLISGSTGSILRHHYGGREPEAWLEQRNFWK